MELEILLLQTPLPRDQTQTTCTDRNRQHLVSPTDAIPMILPLETDPIGVIILGLRSVRCNPNRPTLQCTIAIHRSVRGPPYTTQTKQSTPSLDTWTAGLEPDQSFSTNSVSLDQFLPFFLRFFSLYLSMCSICLEIRDPPFVRENQIKRAVGWFLLQNRLFP